MNHPSKKTIGDFEIAVDFEGWPRWTRIRAGDQEFIFTEEQAHDLLYAMQRIVAFLEDAKQVDRLRGIQA
jgi:hypothetical protein